MSLTHPQTLFTSIGLVSAAIGGAMAYDHYQEEDKKNGISKILGYGLLTSPLTIPTSYYAITFLYQGSIINSLLYTSSLGAAGALMAWYLEKNENNIFQDVIDGAAESIGNFFDGDTEDKKLIHTILKGTLVLGSAFIGGAAIYSASCTAKAAVIGLAYNPLFACSVGAAGYLTHQNFDSVSSFANDKFGYLTNDLISPALNSFFTHIIPEEADELSELGVDSSVASVSTLAGGIVIYGAAKIAYLAADLATSQMMGR